MHNVDVDAPKWMRTTTSLPTLLEMRFPMRPVLLYILLVLGLAIPSIAQQPKEITNSIGMKLVLIHPGVFTMGSPEGEEGRKNNEIQHEVTISKSFFLGAFEVTQEQYEKVMGNNPSSFRGAMNPVETVSWDDAFSFCKKLSDMPEEKAAGREYRLPTEVEWEYACRATSGAAYFFGDSADNLADYAWFGEGRLAKTHPVGEKQPNRWGLYDMLGNVVEWCQDLYVADASGSSIVPAGPKEGVNRVLRGSSSHLEAWNCRVANRGHDDPMERFRAYGFRVAMRVPAKQPVPALTK